MNQSQGRTILEFHQSLKKRKIEKQTRNELKCKILKKCSYLAGEEKVKEKRWKEER